MTGTRGAIAIVGGGPSGLFAAQQLAEAGFGVTVYDRMPSVGRKLLLAGRGGLNLTHSEPLEAFLSRYASEGSTPPNQILGAVRAFDAVALRKWADDLGAETFVGSSGRVFPKSLRATPLLRAWLRKLVDLGVRFEGGWEFAGFTKSSNPSTEVSDSKERSQHQAQVVLKRVTNAAASSAPSSSSAPSGSLMADDDRHPVRLELEGPVLLALGGASWPRLGADGSWVPHFRTAGIAVNTLRASNCGLRIDWSAHVTRFAGQPLKNVALSINNVTKRGELLLDPKGIEGSAAYAIGQAVAQAQSAAINTIELDLRADVSLEHLVARLSKRPPKMSTSTWLAKAGGLSAPAIAVLRDANGPELPVDPSVMAHAIKHVALLLAGTFPIERAISTAGGVALEGVDDHFMLRAHPGVFVAGEMLDWDAPTGGYLLQACFATGCAAAAGIARFSVEQESSQVH
jgi:predicted flavoprotein YhiN